MKDKITVFFIDDQIPKIPEFVEEEIYVRGIDRDELLFLVSEYEWPGEQGLQQIISSVVKSAYAKNHQIEVWGFIHPQIAIDQIENGLNPDVVVFDWEYGNKLDDPNPGEWLLEILDITDAFVFVYSSFKEHIPGTLSKPLFDAYATRFQLFSKKITEDSVFSSEDFLYQYILGLLSSDNVIKIQGIDVEFKSNGYLEKPTDILFLESILGRTALLKAIGESNNEISESSVEEMVSRAGGELFIDRERGFLIALHAQLLIERFEPKEKISFLDVMKEYGLAKLEQAIESGFSRV